MSTWFKSPIDYAERRNDALTLFKAAATELKSIVTDIEAAKDVTLTEINKLQGKVEFLDSERTTTAESLKKIESVL